MTCLRAALASTLAILLVTSSAVAVDVSREEFEALKAEVRLLRDALASQTQVLRQVLERMGSLRADQAPMSAVPIELAGEEAYGRPDAKVTIVEFSDYQCPFCGRYVRETFPQLERDYIATGRVRYVFRDFPVEASHPQAFKAHVAARCAQRQGKRREMHEQLFTHQRALGVADLGSYAAAVGVDRGLFDQCLRDETIATKLRASVSEGERVGVRGTPTFFLGFTESGSTRLLAVRRLVGAQPYSAFQAAIDQLLQTQNDRPYTSR
jgi:protein-disulfide isomerase